MWSNVLRRVKRVAGEVTDNTSFIIIVINISNFYENHGKYLRNTHSKRLHGER